MLHSAGIYLFDFGSLAFVWIGRDVRPKVAVQAYDLAEKALESINCSGRARLEKMSINIVFQGYEPSVFKQAFHQKWKRQDDNIQLVQNSIKEEDEDEQSDDDNTNKLELSADQVKSACVTLTTEAYWIN